MSNRFRHRAPAFLQLATVLLAASPTLAGSWQTNAPFGATLQGDLYSPTTPGTSPAVLVAIHYCSGNKSVVHSWFQSYADQYGFYIIAPDAGKNCFDSSATRAGDRAAIVTMVNYVITNKGADKNRVFSAGLSSGGCMTNTLLAIYPDVFAGGSALPGFPAGTWPAGDTSCTKCGSTPPNNTAQQWGDMARNAFSWSGTRPCVQEWVGGADEYNFNLYLPAVAAQFTNLGGLGSGTAGTGAPSGWTRTVYKDTSGNVRLETNLGPSTQKHDLSSAGLFGYVITFLGLDKATGSCGITSTGTGGSPSTGGAPSTGGSKATGGMSAIGTGGTKAATGGTSSLSTGGTRATGGNTSTTVSPTGGTRPTGGATSIVSNTGGSNATGGTANSTGGTKSTGGAANAGGPANTGGNNTTGGAVGNGGTVANGGAVSTGGLLGNGGTQLTAGGDSSAGGATTDTGGAGNSSDNAGSCSCRVAGERKSSLAGLGGLFGLALLRTLRRKKSR